MPREKDLRKILTLIVGMAMSCLSGCAAFYPMNGVPARYLPDDMKVGERDGKRTIDPSLLEQVPPDEYLIDTGDVLGIYIDSILGKHNENPPVNFPQNSDLPPSAGFPVVVRDNGTISLPMVDPLTVRGKTLDEVERLILQAYTDKDKSKEFLKQGQERILVSLQRKRHTRVLVIRQDSRSEPMVNAFAGQLNLGTAKRGSGKVVSLPAYQNDVLNALVATDGLPGLDAENAVYIIRRPKNRDGRNSIWADDYCDPEEMIRQYKSENKAVIRGQSDGWDYFTRAFDTDPRQTPAQKSQPWSLGDGSTMWNRDDSQFEQQFAPSQSNIHQAANQFRSNQPTPLNSSNQSQFPPPTGWQPQSNFSPQSNLPLQPNLEPQIGSSLSPPNWPAQPFANSQQSAPPVLPGPGHSMPASPTSRPEGGHSGSLHGDSDYGGADTEHANDANPLGDRRIIRIPIRLGPGERININREDVILNDGDIVFIESRDTEVFFTGGLLGGGQFTLPRDFDLNVLQAIAIATSRPGVGAARQIGGVSALNSDVTISPSNLVIIRKLPEGGEIPIKVDIYRARTDPSERIVIQPGDYIFLQYTPVEAVCAFVERHLFEGALLGIFTAQLNNKGN